MPEWLLQHCGWVGVKNVSASDVRVLPGHGALKHCLLFAIILFIGMVARTIAIDRELLWGDEALTLVLSEWGAGLLIFAPVDPTGPFYYLLHKLFIPHGASVAEVRGISLVAGILAIPSIYVLGRLCIGRRGALAAAAASALSFPLVDYSQEARSYSLLVLLVLLSAIGLNGWIRQVEASRPAVSWLILFVAATVLAFSTHLTSIFWIIPAVVGGTWLVLVRGSVEAKRLHLLSNILMAILATPEAGRIVAASNRNRFGWLAQADLQQFVDTVADAWLPTVLWDGTVSSIGALFGVGALIAWRIYKSRQQLGVWGHHHPAALLTICTLVSAPIWVWLFGFISQPIFMPRTILISIPGFLLLLGLLLERARGSMIVIPLVIMYGAGLLTGGTTRQKENWSLVSRTLASGVERGDAVIICPAWKYPAFRHSQSTTLDVPVLMSSAGEIVLLERRLGSSPSYIRDYFRLHYDQSLMKTQNSLSRISRAWVVTSECHARDRSAIRAWLGPGVWRKVVAAPHIASNHKGADVWLFEGIPSRARPVVEFVEPRLGG